MAKQSQRIKNNDAGKTAIIDILSVIKKIYPSLFRQFNASPEYDPRNASYITYSMGLLLLMLFVKYIVSIVSMNAMSVFFENSISIQNLYYLSGSVRFDKIPCFKTVNNFLERLDPAFLEAVRHDIIYELIRSKRISYGRYRKMWMIIIDGTQTYGGNTPINAHCLTKVHNRGKEDETITYHRNVLEAKLWLVGTKIVFSIATEFIENDPNQVDIDTRSAEKQKQDCELTAFYRLAKKLKERFKRLPICIMCDSLYVAQKLMDICKEYGWSYIIRYKDGSAPTIRDYIKVAENGNDLTWVEDRQDKYAFYSGVPYYKHVLNYVRAKIVVDNKETEFQWITNLEITSSRVIKFVEVARGRWKIENQGFQRQKRCEGVLEHLSSWNDTALKNHYLMIQIADIFRILYENEYIVKNEIIQTFKQVATNLCFGFSSIILAEQARVKAMCFWEETEGEKKTTL